MLDLRILIIVEKFFPRTIQSRSTKIKNLRRQTKRAALTYLSSQKSQAQTKLLWIVIWTFLSVYPLHSFFLWCERAHQYLWLPFDISFFFFFFIRSKKLDFFLFTRNYYSIRDMFLCYLVPRHVIKFCRLFNQKTHFY